MSIFSFKKSSGSSVPEWASFFKPKEYSAFIEALKAYFDNTGIPYEIQPGMVKIEEDVFGSGTLGLTNVAQACKQSKLKEYDEVIAGHFNSMKHAQEFHKEFDQTIGDFAAVSKYIGVRMYDTGYINHIGFENAVTRDISGDVHAMLVFDLPDAIQSIKPEEAAGWGKSTHELFELGIENIKMSYPLEITKEDLGGFKSWFVQAQHFFTPNVVFDLKNLPELLGTHGALLGLPHRHSALVYPIENLEIVKAINGMIPIIVGMHEEGPGSLSNQLFWYHDGIFTNLPYSFENNKVSFTPPDNFLKVLNELNPA